MPDFFQGAGSGLFGKDEVSFPLPRFLWALISGKQKSFQKVLYYTILCTTRLHYTALYHTILHGTGLCCAALHCAALRCTVLHCTAQFYMQERHWESHCKGYGSSNSSNGCGGSNSRMALQLHQWDPHCKGTWADQVIPYLQQQGCSSVGLISFCWGAYPMLHAAQSQSKAAAVPVSAAVYFHPSFEHCANAFGEDQEALVRGAGGVPTAVYATPMESKAWKPGGQAEQWMNEAKGAVKPRWELVGQTHGFMTRGDMKGNLALAKEVQRLLEDTIKFIKKHSRST